MGVTTLPRERILRTIAEVVRETQDASGHPTADVVGSLRPVGDLEGFDSLLGVEATILLEQKLGVQFSTESVFVTNHRASTVAEIADHILEQLGAS